MAAVVSAVVAAFVAAAAATVVAAAAATTTTTAVATFEALDGVQPGCRAGRTTTESPLGLAAADGRVRRWACRVPR